MFLKISELIGFRAFLVLRASDTSQSDVCTSCSGAVGAGGVLDVTVAAWQLWSLVVEALLDQTVTVAVAW